MDTVRLAGALAAPAFLQDAQVATMLNETRGYGPRNAAGERAHGVEPLAAVVEMVLADANSTLPCIRAAVGAWESSGGVSPKGAQRDAVALDYIAEILRDPNGRSACSRTSPQRWRRAAGVSTTRRANRRGVATETAAGPPENRAAGHSMPGRAVSAECGADARAGW
ncbi:MAG: hypothetical protein ACP5PM_01570 [Acidimicrobiales bacterium]